MKKTDSPSLFTRLIWVAMLAPFTAHAQTDAKPPVQGTLVLQAGEASTFALPLSDVGKGPGQQDLALFQFNNLFKKGDGVVLYGWQTADLNGVMNWVGSASYKLPVMSVAGGTVLLSTGLDRWHLPSVAETNDWVAANSLYYVRPGKFPINFEADARTVISSNRDFAKGSYLVFNATTLVPLKKVGHYALALRHGPTYIDGLGMYLVNGSRAFRYEGALVVSHRAGYSLEFMGRPQVGLQAGLKDSIYWGFNLTKAIHLFGPRE